MFPVRLVSAIRQSSAKYRDSDTSEGEYKDIVLLPTKRFAHGKSISLLRKSISKVSFLCSLICWALGACCLLCVAPRRMSYGWNTESALLPSTAKKIEVDSSSMAALKAIVYEREDQKSNASHTARGQQKTDVFSKSNSGVKSRAKRDVDTDEKVKAAASLEHLAKKAALYDELKSGRGGDAMLAVRLSPLPHTPPSTFILSGSCFMRSTGRQERWVFG